MTIFPLASQNVLVIPVGSYLQPEVEGEKSNLFVLKKKRNRVDSIAVEMVKLKQQRTFISQLPHL